MSGVLFTVVLLAVCGSGLWLFFSIIDGVAPWHFFRVACPVCGFSNRHKKTMAEDWVTRGFGTTLHHGPPCERCAADLGEPYLSNRYVAGLVAEAHRVQRFKAEAEAYNAAIKVARKGAAA